MTSFDQDHIRKMASALDLAWRSCVDAGYFAPDNGAAREVLARKIVVTAKDNDLSAALLSSEALRYGRQFATMQQRLSVVSSPSITLRRAQPRGAKRR